MSSCAISTDSMKIQRETDFQSKSQKKERIETRTERFCKKLTEKKMRVTYKSVENYSEKYREKKFTIQPNPIKKIKE